MPHRFFPQLANAERMRSLLFFRISWACILILILFQVFFPVWRILPLIQGQSSVPLHYNVNFGVDNIGEWWRVFTAPAVGLLFALVNALGAHILWKREKMLSYVIVGSTLLLELILAAAMIFIVLLNISYG